MQVLNQTNEVYLVRGRPLIGCSRLRFTVWVTLDAGNDLRLDLLSIEIPEYTTRYGWTVFHGGVVASALGLETLF